MVTATPSIVGFTNGYGDRYRDCCGISDKDQGYMASVDRGEHTRDILHAIRDTVVAVEKTGAANSLATEKIGAAAVLTAEKIGSASVLAIHEQSHSLALQLCNTEAKLAAQMVECCCDMRKDLADVKATVLEVDSNRIRDDLAQTRAELLALRSCNSVNSTNPGNS
jgi:hypothetical protein